MSDATQPSEQSIVVETPGWQRIAPRVPDTPQRRELAAQRSVREIVFGAKDGILTTMGVVIGLGVATGNHITVVISGLLALLSGALSMGVGEYQGAKSEREVVKATIEQERSEMTAHPAEEFAEQVAYYKLKGFSSEEAHMIVHRLEKNPEIYLYEMIRDEFGVDPRIAEDSDVRPAFAMSGAYAFGSILPVFPFFFALSSLHALIASAALALIGLFAIGYYAASISGQNRFSRGFEIMLYGSAVFTISFLAGHFIPPLFGFTPVALGG